MKCNKCGSHEIKSISVIKTDHVGRPYKDEIFICSCGSTDINDDCNDDNETWDNELRDFIKTPIEMENFFNEIDILCKKYNLSISHENSHGNFIIEKYSEYNSDWLRSASKGY